MFMMQGLFDLVSTGLLSTWKGDSPVHLVLGLYASSLHSLYIEIMIPEHNDIPTTRCVGLSHKKCSQF
jgi:hypothetical protein